MEPVDPSATGTLRAMKLAAVALVPLLAVAACADTEGGADSPIEAWEQVWVEADDELRANMCGTFRGEFPLHTGDKGPEALYAALEEEGYVLSLDYDVWSSWMDGECG